MNEQPLIHKAGDISVKRVEIVTARGVIINVTNQVVDIKIYEDIFSPFITGEFRLIDSIAIASILPLVGEERVNIELETPSFKGNENVIREQFFLYKMTDRGNINDSAVVYTLGFMAIEGIADANRKISRVFSGKHSDIATQLLGREGLNTQKNKIVEETNSSTKFISNFWTPSQNMHILLDDATNLKRTPSYVFFENREGFVFSSLESLYTIQPMQKFIEDNYIRDMTSTGKAVRNISEDYQRIQNLHVPEFYDYLDRVQHGFYSSSLTSYDLTTKKYTFKTFFAGNATSSSLNPNAPVTGSAPAHSSATRLYVPKYYGNFNGFGDVTNAGSLQKRVALLKKAESYKIMVEVFGRTDYTVGRVVELEIYKNMPIREGDSNDAIIDKMLSGKYLVSAICHVIDREVHMCQMELIKDSILLNLG
jgi:hypothetical protein